MKPGGDKFTIAEQIIDEREGVSGLVLWIHKSGDGFTLTITGNGVDWGNRDFFFGPSGECDGGGTSLCCVPSASWLSPVDTQAETREP